MPANAACRNTLQAKCSPPPHGRNRTTLMLIDGAIVAWYAAPLSHHDEAILDITIGDAKAQQAAEALNLLVALRLWKMHWATERVALEVRNDNVAALTLVLHLKGSSFALNRIARELALDLGDGSFRPDCVSHTPGVASSVADALSRKFDPNFRFAVPTALTGIPETHPAPRSRDWWRSCKAAAH